MILVACARDGFFGRWVAWEERGKDEKRSGDGRIIRDERDSQGGGI